MVNNIIEIVDLKKSFGKREILKGINLEIKQGENIAILGPNGSGKSTLINIMIGLIKQNSGEVKFPILKNDKKEFLKIIGIQSQEGNFPSGFTVQEIIEIVIEIKTDFKYKEYKQFKIKSKERIEELLEVFQIKKIRKSKVNKLSGGEKQRLNILLALLSNPKILILDEISTGLDIRSQNQLIKYIKKYTEDEKITLIIVSHILFEIEALVDQIAMIDNGIIQFKKTKIEIEKKYGSIGNALEKYFLYGEEKI